MAIILEEQVNSVSNGILTKDMVFFGVIKERLEFQKLQAMKDIADARYKMKSFSRQIREIEKNISLLKQGKKVKAKFLDSLPQPDKVITIAQETMIRSYEPQTPALFITTNEDKSSNIEYFPVHHHIWECEKCDNGVRFVSKKSLKCHIEEYHAY